MRNDAPHIIDVAGLSVRRPQRACGNLPDPGESSPRGRVLESFVRLSESRCLQMELVSLDDENAFRLIVRDQAGGPESIEYFSTLRSAIDAWIRTESALIASTLAGS